MEINKEYECHDCGAIFEILHEETEEPAFCPFCCTSLEEAEQLDENNNWLYSVQEKLED